jgi:hypothetical protein
MLSGLSPSKPFELSASYKWLPKRSASAQVAVTGGEPAALRITPEALTLAPGQVMPVKVEAQAEGSEAWKEVQPDLVQWTVPAGVVWTPAADGLRPTVSVAPGATGDMTVEARVEGKAGPVPASLTVTAKENGPEGSLVVDREPHGKYLPVDRSQRYTIMVEKVGGREPAAEVHWPADFENEFVRWQAPVLTAKQAGYTQWLRVEAGQRVALVRITTCNPGVMKKARPRRPAATCPITSRSSATRARRSAAWRGPPSAISASRPIIPTASRDW